MKNSIGIVFLFLICCQVKQGNNSVAHSSNVSQIKKAINKQDSLFVLDINKDENQVRIIPPEAMGFSLPDSSTQTAVYKSGDFNADNKEDVLVSFGACGSGGCMYGLFLNQYDTYYTLAFMDYLKGPAFQTDKRGFWIITSYEEIEPYDPSKLRVSLYTFEQTTSLYTLDTTFLSRDKAED